MLNKRFNNNYDNIALNNLKSYQPSNNHDEKYNNYNSLYLPSEYFNDYSSYKF